MPRLQYNCVHFEDQREGCYAVHYSDSCMKKTHRKTKINVCPVCADVIKVHDLCACY